MTNGEFPKILKKSKITPIYKKGNKELINFVFIPEKQLQLLPEGIVHIVQSSQLIRIPGIK